MSTLLDVFRVEGRISRLLIVMFIAINGWVLVNVCLHSPLVGYDTGENLKNVRWLSDLNWPTSDQSLEFFSPPLPFVIPAAALAAGASLWWAAKISQFANFFLSLGLTYFLLRLCDQFSPGQLRFKALVLALLGMLPVYYKTFSFLRGEPYLAFLTVFSLEMAVRIFIRQEFRLRNLLFLGFGLGLAVLSRQWGFFLFPAIIFSVVLLVLKNPSIWKKQFLSLLAVLIVAFLVGSWFYFYLFHQYGTFTAFNREPQRDGKTSESFVGLGGRLLFVDPIRPSFADQAIPVFYSDLWGDYHGYFSVYTRDTVAGVYLPGYKLANALKRNHNELPDGLETNRFTFNAYLGRVNLVSLLPSLFLLAGFLYGLYSILLFVIQRQPTSETMILGLFSLVISVSLAGYAWFVLRYPNPGNADTVKAAYLLHVYPLMAIQLSVLLCKIRAKWVVPLLAVVLTLVVLHNLPAMLTHFIELP